MLDSYEEGDFDILLLPEMTFTGYCFESKTDIEPFVEDVHGPSIQWAKEQGSLS
jgi:protein N-terminal amidase